MNAYRTHLGNYYITVETSVNIFQVTFTANLHAKTIHNLYKWQAKCRQALKLRLNIRDNLLAVDHLIILIITAVSSSANSTGDNDQPRCIRSCRGAIYFKDSQVNQILELTKNVTFRTIKICHLFFIFGQRGCLE